MAREDWIWMPHPGHFFLAKQCRFKLSTYVNGYIVSTVGEWWPDESVRRIFAKVEMELDPEKKIDLFLKGDLFDREYMRVFGYKEIGLNRIYETMVFKAKPIEKEVKCCPFLANFEEGELDFETYNSSEDAMKGHYELCEKWDKMTPKILEKMNAEIE